MTPPPPDSAAGRRLGPYVLESKLGPGGAGDTWLTTDPAVPGRQVVIKVLRRDGLLVGRGRGLREMVVREAQALAAVDRHPNIVKLHTVTPVGDDLALQMEYVRGRRLAELVEEATSSGRQGLDEATACGIASQVARACAFVHSKGRFHGDLSPGNVLVEADGTARVIDFGIAPAVAEFERLAREFGVAHHMPRGTPGFSAPERASGDGWGAPADVWAVGQLLLWMCRGGLPGHESSDAAEIRLPRGYSETLAEIVRDCGGPPSRRPAAAELAERLESIGRGLASAPCMLPRSFTSFVGRAREWAVLGEALASGSLVEVVGPGGAGKSRLVAEAGRSSMPHFAGAFVVDACAVGCAAGLRGALESAIAGRMGPHAAARLEAARPRASERVLAVVENGEALSGDADAALRGIASAWPGCVLVVCSRVELVRVDERAAGFTRIRLGHLDAGTDTPGHGAAARITPAVRLLLDRLPPHLSPAVPEPSQAGRLLRICDLLDGLPLMVELAAAAAGRGGHRGLDGVLDELESRLSSDAISALEPGPGAGGSAGAGSLAVSPERHGSPARVLAWSWERLSEPARRLAERASTFGGGFDTLLVDSVCNQEVAWSLFDLDAALGELVRASLLSRRMKVGSEGVASLHQFIYEFAPLVRAYATARLEESEPGSGAALLPLLRRTLAGRLAAGTQCPRRFWEDFGPTVLGASASGGHPRVSFLQAASECLRLMERVRAAAKAPVFKPAWEGRPEWPALPAWLPASLRVSCGDPELVPLEDLRELVHRRRDLAKHWAALLPSPMTRRICEKASIPVPPPWRWAGQAQELNSILWSLQRVLDVADREGWSGVAGLAACALALYLRSAGRNSEAEAVLSLRLSRHLGRTTREHSELVACSLLLKTFNGFKLVGLESRPTPQVVSGVLDSLERLLGPEGACDPSDAGRLRWVAVLGSMSGTDWHGIDCPAARLILPAEASPCAATEIVDLRGLGVGHRFFWLSTLFRFASVGLRWEAREALVNEDELSMYFMASVPIGRRVAGPVTALDVHLVLEPCEAATYFALQQTPVSDERAWRDGVNSLLRAHAIRVRHGSQERTAIVLMKVFQTLRRGEAPRGDAGRVPEPWIDGLLNAIVQTIQSGEAPLDRPRTFEFLGSLAGWHWEARRFTEAALLYGFLQRTERLVGRGEPDGAHGWHATAAGLLDREPMQVVRTMVLAFMTGYCAASIDEVWPCLMDYEARGPFRVLCDRTMAPGNVWLEAQRERGDAWRQLATIAAGDNSLTVWREVCEGLTGEVVRAGAEVDGDSSCVLRLLAAAPDAMTQLTFVLVASAKAWLGELDLADGLLSVKCDDPPPTRAEIGLARLVRAHVAAARGRYQEAELLLDTAEEDLDPGRWLVVDTAGAEALRIRAALELRAGRPREALRRLVESRRRSASPWHRDLVGLDMAAVLLRLGRPASALVFAERADESLGEGLAASHRWRVRASELMLHALDALALKERARLVRVRLLEAGRSVRARPLDELTADWFTRGPRAGGSEPVQLH